MVYRLIYKNGGCPYAKLAFGTSPEAVRILPDFGQPWDSMIKKYL
jgi:hypothetical protein